MPDLRYAINTDTLKPGRVTQIEIEDRFFTICNDGGTFYVIDNFCPHANGPLGQGDLEDGCIVCPIHGWPFSLETGLTDPNMPWMRLKFYAFEIRDGKLYVDITGPLPPPIPQ